MIRELEDAGAQSQQDIPFLYLPAIERLQAFGGTDKAKLYFLAEVLSKDSAFTLLNCSPNGVRCRLSELAQLQKLNADKKGKNEITLKYARKLTLPSFNGQME